MPCLVFLLCSYSVLWMRQSRENQVCSVGDLSAKKNGWKQFCLFFTAPVSDDLVFQLPCIWGFTYITVLFACKGQRPRKCVFCFQWRKWCSNISWFHLFYLHLDIKGKLETRKLFNLKSWHNFTNSISWDFFGIVTWNLWN